MPWDPSRRGSGPSVAYSKGEAYWSLCTNLVTQTIQENSTADNTEDEDGFGEDHDQVRRLSNFMMAAENFDIDSEDEILVKRKLSAHKNDHEANTSIFGRDAIDEALLK